MRERGDPALSDAIHNYLFNLNTYVCEARKKGYPSLKKMKPYMQRWGQGDKDVIQAGNALLSAAIRRDELLQKFKGTRPHVDLSEALMKALKLPERGTR